MRSVLISPLSMHATAASSAIIASPPTDKQPQQHKQRLSRPQGKHNINPHLCCLPRRKPTQTPTTLQPGISELARGLWDMWSSCCSSRCTCPRAMTDHRLISMQLVHTIFQTCKQQLHYQLHFNISCDACNTITDIAPVLPPAKIIKPISSDAAAKSDRPCSIFASWQAVQDSDDLPAINGL
jgi:hypothetical protein